jgi:molybdenum cofactor synthesis domain-containing protein
MAEQDVRKQIRIRAATLAVGTEVTDGQILDRNSAWISERLVRAGIEVIEHRAVADNFDEIARASKDLVSRVDLLFVTGGLGPTSDDFTRVVLSDVFSLPLIFDDESWQQVQEKLAQRGVVTRDIQRQQCFFPTGASVLFNPAGTANAFTFAVPKQSKPAKQESQETREHHVKSEYQLTWIYALPGPPSEIASIWESAIQEKIESLVPPSDRETLHIYRCLGRAESEVAEKTEAAINGSGLRVGYRAHAPYVEVKLWVRVSEQSKQAPIIARLEQSLGDWITNRNYEDVADAFMKKLALIGSNNKKDDTKGNQNNSSVDNTTGNTVQKLRFIDRATEGVFQERMAICLKEWAKKTKMPNVVLETHLGELGVVDFPNLAKLEQPVKSERPTKLERDRLLALADFEMPDCNLPDSNSVNINLLFKSGGKGWLLLVWRAAPNSGESGASEEIILQTFEIQPPYNYNLSGERGRKFVTEKVLQILGTSIELSD